MSQPRPITEIADQLGIAPRHLLPYGHDKAKIHTDARQAAADGGRQPGRLVLVSAITPTRFGEGKTTTSIGLSQGLAKLGKRVCLTLREPSLGPTFGVKGGATGGGRSIVVPAADIDMHFTGDFHAISAANNLLAALLDNHLQRGNELGIDPRRVDWKRVIDLNDRSLRRTVIGLGGPTEGMPRETGFDITPASEVMATLCLAQNADDLRRRLSRLVVASTYDKEPVTAGDLKAVGAMMVLLKDAIMPNLVQTGEGVPALIHGGPFANIAHGCNSVIATRMALAHADWVVTEAGFGFDLGAEKFFDIKCTSAGLDPAAVVLVATVRALKLHGGAASSQLTEPDPGAVEKGLCNLEKHLESVAAFGVPAVVAINRFDGDTDEEVAVIRAACDRLGVPCALSEIFAKGGEGGIEMAEAVLEQAAAGAPRFTPLYDWSEPIPTKMEKIARTMYGAGEVHFEPRAARSVKRIERMGYGGLPLCVAKTPASLSDNPRLVGRPRDFEITVRDVVLAAGAGFVVPLLGDIMRMPGLPKSPQAERMDLIDGEVVGLM